MTHAGAVARDITYAHSAQTRAGRAMIRLMENASGRIGLIRAAQGYQDEIAAGRDFWQVMVDRYRLEPRYLGAGIDAIPREGPLIVVANHPFGILDGLMMGHLLARRRGAGFRILAHQVFGRAPELEGVILPVDFAPTKEAQAVNIATRRAALDQLAQGGAIGIFPGGTVSTAARPFGVARDPQWRSFTAKMIAKSNATILPVYFDGHNSRLFQIASHLHYTLRMGLLIREFRARVGTPVPMIIGAPITRAVIDAHRDDPAGLMDILRQTTYGLDPRGAATAERGYEFEARYRQGQRG